MLPITALLINIEHNTSQVFETCEVSSLFNHSE